MLAAGFATSVAFGFLIGRATAPLVIEVAPPELTGRVVRVTDGDTIVVLVEALRAGADEPGPREVKVRLAGIDAPEKKQDYGSAARKALADKAMGRSVTVREQGRDRYGRTIGVVSIDGGASERGEEINRWLVEQGWAWRYARYSDSAELAALEQEARAAKRGLWAGANPVAPWEWRKNSGQVSGDRGQ